jgi:signal transduction histidine kinase
MTAGSIASKLQTVRVRATVGATVIVAIALVVAGGVLVNVLRRSQVDIVDGNLRLRAVDIEGLIDGGAELSSVTVQSEEGGLVQIIDPSGAVIAASENLTGEPPLVSSAAPSSTTMRIAQLDDAKFRVATFETDGARTLRIVVGSDIGNIDRTVDVVIGALAIGLPLLLLLIAVLVWVIVGRALLPVERMRREVDEIGGGDLHRRVRAPETNDEIARLATTMNAMLDRLERANTIQARFVSDASHELRTPIAVIRHELEVALREDDDQLLRQVAGDVLDEDLRMQRLVDDLLFLARRESTATRPSPRRVLVDLDDVVLDEAHRVDTSKRVDTSCVSAGQVRADPDQLGRIVRNLLDNALRHAATTVAVTVTSNDATVWLHVDDDGPGVPQEDRELIFERFGRSDHARSRDDGGAGLGLAIVSELVADHGATIVVATSPTLGGARFSVGFADTRD